MKEPLKLSASTLSYQDWDLDELLYTLKGSGVSAIELRMNLSDWSTLDTEESQKDMQEKLNAYGMEISDLGTTVCVNTYNPEALNQLRKDMEIAKRMGVKGLRIMFGSWRTRWSEEIPLDYEGICRWIKEADEIAAEYSREIWIETHYEFATGKMLKKLFEDCRLKHCKVVWDVLHPLEQGENMQDTYAYLKDYLVHMHIKDGMPWQDTDLANWKYAVVGEGEVPIKEIVEMVLKDGYQGYFSMEWEPAWHEEIRGLDNRKILQDYPRYMNAL